MIAIDAKKKASPKWIKGDLPLKPSLRKKPNGATHVRDRSKQTRAHAMLESWKLFGYVPMHGTYRIVLFS
jgi:hypothetical protein